VGICSCRKYTIVTSAIREGNITPSDFLSTALQMLTCLLRAAFTSVQDSLRRAAWSVKHYGESQGKKPIPLLQLLTYLPSCHIHLGALGSFSK